MEKNKNDFHTFETKNEWPYKIFKKKFCLRWDLNPQSMDCQTKALTDWAMKASWNSRCIHYLRRKYQVQVQRGSTRGLKCFEYGWVKLNTHLYLQSAKPNRPLGGHWFNRPHFVRSVKPSDLLRAYKALRKYRYVTEYYSKKIHLRAVK